MARRSEEESSGTGQELVTKTYGDLSTEAGFDASEVEGLSGLGYSEKAEDSLVPIVSILQENSAEAKQNHSRAIAGARPGMLIIRSLKKVIEVTKEKPLPVQPCGFEHYWVQWRGEPGEGSVITQYPFDDRPEEAKEKDDPNNPDRTFWQMPNGDRLVDTRYHYSRIYIDDGWMTAVFPMAGTNHTVSRSWTAQQKMVRIPNTSTPAPAWFRVYGFNTDYNQRGTQSWFTYGINPLGWVNDKAHRDEGRKIFESLEARILRPDVESEAVVDKDADSQI